MRPIYLQLNKGNDGDSERLGWVSCFSWWKPLNRLKMAGKKKEKVQVWYLVNKLWLVVKLLYCVEMPKMLGVLTRPQTENWVYLNLNMELCCKHDIKYGCLWWQKMWTFEWPVLGLKFITIMCGDLLFEVLKSTCFKMDCVANHTEALLRRQKSGV